MSQPLSMPHDAKAERAVIACMLLDQSFVRRFARDGEQFAS